MHIHAHLLFFFFDFLHSTFWLTDGSFSALFVETSFYRRSRVIEIHSLTHSLRSLSAFVSKRPSIADLELSRSTHSLGHTHSTSMNIAICMCHTPRCRPWSGRAVLLGTWTRSPLPPMEAPVVVGHFDRRGRFARRVIHHTLDGHPIVGVDIPRVASVSRDEVRFLPWCINLTEDRLRAEVNKHPSTRGTRWYEGYD